jgi:hypothetical protein
VADGFLSYYAGPALPLGKSPKAPSGKKAPKPKAPSEKKAPKIVLMLYGYEKIKTVVKKEKKRKKPNYSAQRFC